jgi:DNA repair protein RecO (recombination protein O)
MHQWDDSGIIISVTRYGEQSAIVRLFTAHHGLCAGMVKGVYSKKSRGIFQPGNRVHAHWQARLEEHLGAMRCELVSSVTAQLLASPLALKLINAATALILTAVHERVSDEEIYNKIRLLVDEVNSSDDQKRWLFAYTIFEFCILHELGFGLDLSECAAMGKCNPEELVYVSPKSGKAVSAEAGLPYKHKLLALPTFLRDGHPTDDVRQMLDGLALTGYFLDAWVLQPEGRKLPEARHELLAAITRDYADNLV